MRYPALRQSGWRKVQSSAPRFLSILLMVALGAFVFVGLVSTAPSLERTLYTYLSDQAMPDLTISHPLGLDAKDRAKLESLPQVSRLVYSQQIHQVVAETDHVLILESLEDLPTFKVREGRLPSQAGEIALGHTLKAEYTLGQVLTIDSGAKEEDPLLTTDLFTVVGFVESPYYLGEDLLSTTSAYGDGSVAGFGILAREVFVGDTPSQARLVFADVQALEPGGDLYTQRMQSHQDRVTALFDTRASTREENLRKTGNAGLTQAERVLQDAENQLASGRRSLDQAQAQLDQAKRGPGSLADQRAKAEEGFRQGERDLQEAQRKLDQAESQILAGEADLLAGQAAIAKGRAALAPLDKSLKDESRSLEKAEREAQKGQAKLDQAANDLQKAQGEAAQGQAQLDTAKRTLQDRQTALRQAFADIQEGQGALAAGKAALGQAQAQISGLNQKVQGLEALVRQTQSQLASDPSHPLLQAKLQAQKQELSQTKALLSRSQQTLARETRALQQNEAKARQALAQVEEGQHQINLAQAEVQRKQADLNQVRQTLAQARTNYDQQKGEFDQAKTLFTSGKAQIQAGQSRLIQEKQKLVQAQAQLDASRAQLAQAKNDLFQGQAEVRQGLHRLESQKQATSAQFQKGQEKLDQGKRDLAQAQAQITKEREAYEGAYADRLAAIRENQADIQEGRADLARIQVPSYEITTWATDPIIDRYAQSAQGMRLMSAIFPAFFYGICLLICLTTMTRMIDDERSEIGTLKGLGYPSSAIMTNYMAYGAFAAVPGTLIGIIGGYYLLMPVIVDAYYAGTVFQDPIPVLPPLVPLFALVIDLACTSFAAYSAGRIQLKSSVATLLRPVPPKAGTRIFLERITPFWKRLNFNQKITFRNLFRYKKRGALTIVGVAGCMALITMGFGLSYAINGIFERQFGDIQDYDLIALYDDKAPLADQDQALRPLLDPGSYRDATSARYETATLPIPGATDQILTLVTPMDPDHFQDFVRLQNPKTRESLDLRSGAVLSEKTARILNLKPGDLLTYQADDGKTQAVPILGICENYVGHTLYLSPQDYENLLGQKPNPNALYLQVQDPGQVDTLARTFLTSKYAFAAIKASSSSTQIEDLTQSLNIVVKIIVLVSLLLALVVLYNLTNINVEERMRELSTIKVLGFYPKEVTAYVYRESLILTAIGIGLGALLGKAIHTLIARALAPASVMMVEVVLPQDYALGTLFTLGASFLVMLVMHYKLKNVDMVAALKGVE